MDFKIMWKKSGRDAVKTAIAGGLAGAGISITNTAEVGIEQAVCGLVTAVISSVITGLFNWLKHK